MKYPQSIGDFLDQTGCDFRVFDLGRRIIRLGRSEFAAIEAGEQPYPQPLQQQAWLGIIGWDKKQPDEQFVWFLKLPLDESGCLIPSARDGFLSSLIEQAAVAKKGEELPEALHDSPFGFKPRQETMAVFHAKVLKALGKPPSQFAEHARNYLAGELGYEQWAFVGIQGLADIAARLDEDDNEALLVKAVAELPVPPLAALCTCLEHERLGTPLAEALNERLQRAVAEGDPSLAVALLRGLSYAQASGLRRERLKALLDGPLAANIELLAAVVARCWEDLKEPGLMRRYLEVLAEQAPGTEGFTPLVAELMMIPGMRAAVLAELRNPDRSAALSAAVEAMFKTQLD